MFNPVLLPPPNEQIDRLLNGVIVGSRASKDDLEFIKHSLDRSQKKFSEAIEKAPTVSEYFQSLWDSKELTDNTRDYVDEAVEESGRKNVEAVLGGGLIIREKPLDIEEQILPNSKIGKLTRNRFDEKGKHLLRCSESPNEKRYLSAEIYNSDYAEVMKYVSKPVNTSSKTAKLTPIMHYNSVGNLMVGASEEIEIIRQHQAEEFVKRINEEKDQFEKKIRELEARIEQKEKTELERLREYEEKKELAKLQKKKKELEKTLNDIKLRQEERLKRKEEWENIYKSYKDKKPLYAQIQERYQKEIKQKDKENDEKKLKEIHDFHKPLNHRELLEHEKKFLKHLEEQQSKRESLKPLRTSSTPMNPMIAEMLKQQRVQKDELLDEKKRIREKLQHFNLKVSKHRIHVDPAKEEEMKQLIQKLQDQSRSKRSTKGDDPIKLPDENELNMQRTKRLQNLVIAKNMRKYETAEDEREARKMNTKEEQAFVYPNYWNDVKRKLHIKAQSDDWKNILSSKDLTKKDKTEAVLIEADKLEEKARMKERLWRVRKGKPDSIVQYIQEADEVDDFYINSIKAKLSLLSNQNASQEPESKPKDGHFNLSEKNRSVNEKTIHESMLEQPTSKNHD